MLSTTKSRKPWVFKTPRTKHLLALPELILTHSEPCPCCPSWRIRQQQRHKLPCGRNSCRRADCRAALSPNWDWELRRSSGHKVGRQLGMEVDAGYEFADVVKERGRRHSSGARVIARKKGTPTTVRCASSCGRPCGVVSSTRIRSLQHSGSSTVGIRPCGAAFSTRISMCRLAVQHNFPALVRRVTVGLEPFQWPPSAPSKSNLVHEHGGRVVIAFQSSPLCS